MTTKRKGAKKMGEKGKAAREDDNPEVREFITRFGQSAPHPDAMGGRYTFRPGDGFDGPLDDVEDGWYTDGVWSVRFEGLVAKEAVRCDVEKPEDASDLAIP